MTNTGWVVQARCGDDEESQLVGIFPSYRTAEIGFEVYVNETNEACDLDPEETSWEAEYIELKMLGFSEPRQRVPETIPVHAAQVEYATAESDGSTVTLIRFIGALIWSAYTRADHYNRTLLIPQIIAHSVGYCLKHEWRGEDATNFKRDLEESMERYIP